MARVPDAEIGRLKAEVPLVSLAEAAGVELARTGADLTGRCPFHDDDSPSLVISPGRNLWHCVGACQAGGSVIDWVMRAEGVSFRHAVELLRDGPLAVSPAGAGPRRSTVRRLAPPVELTAADHELLGQVTGYYHKVLKDSTDALGYLARRKIDHPEAIGEFRLGYADRTLGLRLPGKRRKDGAEVRGRLEALGIFRASGHEHLAGSLVIPVFDEHGNVAEAYGRKVRDDLRAGTPRYLYLPGPHRGVWNLPAVAACDEVIVCESLVDALTFWCAGFRHVTACYGAGRVHPGSRAGLRAASGAADADRVRPRRRRGQGGPGAGGGPGRPGGGVLPGRVPAGAGASDVAVGSKDPAGALGRAIRSAAWMGAGPGPARRRDAPLPEPAPPPEPVPVSAAVPAPAGPPAVPPAVSPAPVVAEEPAPAVSGGEASWRFGERAWRVRGLDKASSFESLRVNVMVSSPDGQGGTRFHVDTADLYSARARAAFVAAAAAELGAEPEVIRRDLGRVLPGCERLAGQTVTAAQAPAR